MKNKTMDFHSSYCRGWRKHWLEKESAKEIRFLPVLVGIRKANPRHKKKINKKQERAACIPWDKSYRI